MINANRVRSDLPIPPGEYLVEVLEQRMMTQVDLARRMGRPPQAINEIVKAEKAITPETALQLEKVVGVPAHVWTGLEAEYQLALAQKHECETIQAEVPLLAELPYKELIELELVNKVRDPLDRIRELRRFFGVSSLRNLKLFHAAFRVAKHKAASQLATAAWLRAGEVRATRLNAKQFDRGKLKASLSILRDLTKAKIEVAEPRLRDVLAACGVAFVSQRHFPKTYVNGATFWLSQNVAAMLITIRGAWADIFWFSIFHELGHILLHGKNEVFLEDQGDRDAKPEIEADEFASNSLIPAQAYRNFRAALDWSAPAITRFADEIGVAPGIVVGRLQHDQIIGYNQHHALRSKLVWR